MNKKWYTSKTVWMNLLTLAAAFLAMPELTSLGIAPETLLKVSAVVNIGLRCITSGAVTK